MLIGPHEDGVIIDADDSVAAFLVGVTDMLDTLNPREDAARRLAPPVYLDDPEANAEWWGYMRGDLERGREEDLDVFRRVIEEATNDGGTIIDTAEAYSLVRVAVQLRLVVAARVGVDTEEDYEGLGAEDRALLDALGAIQMGLLTAVQHPDAGGRGMSQ